MGRGRNFKKTQDICHSERNFCEARAMFYSAVGPALRLQIWLHSSECLTPEFERGAPTAWSRRFKETQEGMNLTCQPAPLAVAAHSSARPPSVFPYQKKKKKKLHIAAAINYRGGRWNVKLNGIRPLTPLCCGKRIWTCELRRMEHRTRRYRSHNCQVAANWFKWRMMGLRGVDAGSPLNEFKAQGAVYYPPVMLHYVWKCWPNTADGTLHKYSWFISSRRMTWVDVSLRRRGGYLC